MGAYLSEPVTEKHSESGSNDKLSFGATSVQGWRINQEDSHNAILDFDDNCSLFAVYDGHGGAEVSDYTSKHLPDFLKTSELFQNGELVRALEKTFLDFDFYLTREEVVANLKEIAGLQKSEEEDVTEDKSLLVEEARLPLEEVLRKYGIKFFRSDEASGLGHDNHKVSRSCTDSEPELPTEDSKTGKRTLIFSRKSETKSSINGTESCISSSTSDTIMINVSNSGDDRVKRKHKPQAGELSELESLTPPESQNPGVCLLSPEIKRAKKEEMESEVKEASQGLVCNGNSTHCLNDGPNLDSVTSEPTIPDLSAAPKLNIVHAGSTAVANGYLPHDSDLTVPSSQENGIDSDSLLPEPVDSAPAKTDEVDALPLVNSNSNNAGNGNSPKTVPRARADSETDSMGAAFKGTPPNSWKSMSNLSDLPVSESKKKGIVEGKFTSKGKAPIANPDLSSSDESEDADYECNASDEDEETGSTDNSTNKSSEGDTPDTDSGADKNEENWNEGVDLPESEDDDEEEELEEEEFTEASEEMFQVPNGDMPGVDSGTTACVAVLKEHTLYVANAGDSRCVLCRGTTAIDLSVDHKPEDPLERLRIENAGGQITADGRVNGGLNLSRALGDHFYKRNTSLPLRDQMITALPDIRVETLTSEDRFLVIACDGIWNSLTSQQVVDFVSEKLAENMALENIAGALCDKCLAPSTVGDGTGCDNMTVIVVDVSRVLTAATLQDKPAETEKIELPTVEAEIG